MTDRELLELIASQISTLTTQVDTITTQVDGLTKDMDEVKAELTEVKDTMATKQELASVKAIVVKIENDHGQKLNALFDGYKLNSEKLDRIEAEVSKHEEFIIKRLK